jgi:nucleoside-diphosphate-sugar epimerase
VKKFIHASTGSVYGEALYPQDEDHPTNPASYYGVSKLAGEKYVQLFHNLHGLNTTILRYFHVYGRRQDNGNYGGVIAIWEKNLRHGIPLTIYGDGTQERSFTHVDDVVKANLVAMETGDGHIYNCASAISVTLNELAYAMKKLFNKPGHPVVYKDWMMGDVRRFDIDNRKIRSHLGIIFETDIKNGLKKTIWEK